jgi:NNP family nitrate/nitrite transporter-like MFS transporter
MIGGLGGFVLPITFGVMNDLVGVWTSCFMLLFAIVAVALVWMHVSIRQMERAAVGETLAALPAFPEMEGIHDTARHGRGASALVTDWRPEDPAFWQSTGRQVAQRNLWISIPCLLLTSCSGWPPCPACPAPRFGSSTPSWCRSSAAGCGPRCRPRRC